MRYTAGMQTDYFYTNYTIRPPESPPWVAGFEKALHSELLAEAMAQLEDRRERFGPRAGKAAGFVLKAYAAVKMTSTITGGAEHATRSTAPGRASR